jgi:DNA modification methylase
MTYTRKEVIGDCVLYQGDCLEVMPTLGRVDAVVTDPPYGIDYGRAGGFSEKSGWKQWRGKAEWDVARPNLDTFDCIRKVSENQIIWGGNYFADMLPPSMGWLSWDKAQRGFSLADFELAWTSRQAAARAFVYGRGNENGFAPGSKEPAWARGVHPTQKPVALMKWCLGFLPDADTILDPFMGSGTTIVACAKLGRKGIGIELDPDYFEIACKRVEEAYRQPDLFVEPPAPQPKQEGFDV